MLATMNDAHREWHSNSGVPMGQPGCPQDACHLDDYEEPMGRTAKCGCGCGIRLPLATIRLHFGLDD